MRFAALLLAAALAGCSTHATWSVQSGSPAPASGTAVVSGPSGLTVSSSSLVPVVAAAMAVAAAADYSLNPQPFPSPSSLFPPNVPAPELAANRRISKQDCSKPVDLTLGNLRCK